ncbi:MAG: MATE family efflux transporter, partial [Eubacterium sp.]|nr:MATE family efflux transporter [Eubacterium sp.]
MEAAGKYSFFTKDKTFRKKLIIMMVAIALQNFIAYSVNMADNIMLGSYGQVSLSGAATVNQIFFIIQQIMISIAEITVMIGSQYWGRNELSPIRKLAGIALKTTAVFSVIIFLLCLLIPEYLLRIFTSDEAIILEGMSYLRIIKYSFVLFMFSTCLLGALRTVEVVQIAFRVSIVTLIINVGINWILIFGNLGAPRMGIVGAAVGTLIARIVEFLVILIYVWKVDKKLCLFSEKIFQKDARLSKDFAKAAVVMIPAEFCWAIATPFQSAMLGAMSADAIAANSIATTFYNYLKVIIRAIASTSAVLIGSAIGAGDLEEVKAKGRTISVICIVIGGILGLLLLLLRGPLLSLYSLTPEAMSLTSQMIALYAVIMVGMS